MVVDSSAIVAIALLEPGARQLADKLFDRKPIVAAPTLLEAHIVLTSRLGPIGGKMLETVLADYCIETVAFGPDQLREACLAFDRFGKGRHAASLNFGDCMSYALSQLSGQPLLFVGSDFTQTDVQIA